MPTVIVLMHVDQCREDEYHKNERSGFDGMEKEKKGREERVIEGMERERKSKEEEDGRSMRGER